jgi:CheY-like chemotaxis protein
MGGAHPRERVGLKAQYATLEQAQIMQQEACNRPAVLVVEDEILLRWTAASVIDETGFNASEAGSAVEAISMLERRNDVWAVVTDVQMPGSIDGLKLAHLIKVRWPNIKVIVTSGQLKLREDDVPAGCRYLHKPYNPSQLIGILKDWVANE